MTPLAGAATLLDGGGAVRRTMARVGDNVDGEAEGGVVRLNGGSAVWSLTTTRLDGGRTVGSPVALARGDVNGKAEGGGP